MKAIWNGKVIAESGRTIEIEGNRYFPRSAVKNEFLEESSHTSHCSWKGDAHYFTLNVDGERNENAAWYYPDPKEKAREIKGMVAFWKGVKVEE